MSGPHGGTHTLLGDALWHHRGGGSLTRYLGNLYRTLGAAAGLVQAASRIKTHSYACFGACYRILFAGAVRRALPLGQDQVYSFAMIQLPPSYQEYLADKDESFVDMVRPVLLQSAADKLHGVRVLYVPRGHQAHLDDTIPYGTIVEDID